MVLGGPRLFSIAVDGSSYYRWSGLVLLVLNHVSEPAQRNVVPKADTTMAEKEEAPPHETSRSWKLVACRAPLDMPPSPLCPWPPLASTSSPRRVPSPSHFFATRKRSSLRISRASPLPRGEAAPPLFSIAIRASPRRLVRGGEGHASNTPRSQPQAQQRRRKVRHIHSCFDEPASESQQEE